MKRRKASGTSQKRISAKIQKIRRAEPGRDPKQAIAMAYNMERRGRLGPRGSYRRVRRSRRK